MPATTLSQPRRLKPLLALACALAGLTCACAYAREDARLDTPAHAYGVQMQLAVHGQASAPLLTVEENKPFGVGSQEAGKPWHAEFVLNRVHDTDADVNGAKARVRLAGTITEDGKVLAKPTLVGALGERMAIQVGEDVKLAFVVKDIAP
jgi:hypothetical protein